MVEAVNGVSFSIAPGEILGVVGETGAGKTTIGLSIMGLLPKPPANVIQNSILLNGEELLNKNPRPKNVFDFLTKRRYKSEEKRINKMMRHIPKTITMMFQDSDDCAESSNLRRRSDSRSNKDPRKSERADAEKKACDMLRW